MQVDFYQLGRDPLAAVLTSIAGRVLSSGERLLIVTGDEAQAAMLDEALWTQGPDGFLPHGRAGGQDEGRDQPVLIAATCAPANAAKHVALIDGVWRDEACGFERAFHFFDDTSVEAAREAWRSLKARPEVEPRYWRQEEGRWRQVA